MNGRKRRCTALATLVLLTLLQVTLARGAHITIVNNDGAGEGFNDPTPVSPVAGNSGTTLGAQRLIAFQYAADIWGCCIASAVPITVRAQMDPQTCTPTSAILGSAGTISLHRDFAGAPRAGTYYSSALANSLAGVDLDPSTPDINATFNSNINGSSGCLGGESWYYGLDGNPPGNDIDFITVVLHEIGHGLGCQTFVSSAGVKPSGFDDQYMIFLERHGASPADYPSMTDAQRAAANISDPNLHWTGPLVTAEGAATLSAGISGGHVRMHGPNPYQNGSSLSHWSTALSPDEAMEPAYTNPNHDPGLACTMMHEIGWKSGVIAQQPTNQVMTFGQDSQFTFQADGPGITTYQWQKLYPPVDLHDTDEDGYAYSGTTTQTLTILTADYCDVGVYQCVATSNCGTVTSQVVELNCVDLPTIFSQPVDVVTTPGQNVTFTVGIPPFYPACGGYTFHWYNDTKMVGLLASGSVLHINNVSTADLGFYHCEISNACGSVSTQQVRLSIDWTRVSSTRKYYPHTTDNDKLPRIDHVQLVQNSPNPFNPQTQIRFGLPVAADVSLVVYDVEGHRIRTLVRGPQPGGVWRTVSWDGRSDAGTEVAGGIYFCRLVAAGTTTTRKMVLLK